MLNELEQLRRSLSANGIQTSAWHPWIKPLAKYTTLLVRLNGQGEPASVVELQRDRAAKLRNIQPDNQNSFPAFNLNCPIFESPSGMDLNATTTMAADALESMHLAYEARQGKVPALDRLRRLLREFPTNELTGPFLVRAADPLLGSTLQLLQLLNNGWQSPEEFLRSFAVALIDAIRRGDISNELMLDVLFGRLSKKGVREPWQCILFLDLEDLSPFQSAVADPNTAASWSAALLSGSDAGGEAAIECALDGRTGPGIGDKMPNPNLPLLGGTYLFSMNSEIPCQTRYGRSSTAIFPVTRHAIQGANDALLHMTAANYKGKTWSPVPSGTGEKPDLLIAYIEEAPDLGTPAAVFGTADEEDEDGVDEESSSSGQMSLFIGRLNALLNAVQMKGGPEVRGARNLRLFVLSTIDKGRKQVLFDARYNVAKMEQARDHWIEGAQNVPALQVQVFQGRGKKTSERSGSIPSPLAVARSFRDLWIRKGERSEKVPGVSLARLYKLLLDPDEADAKSLLERYLPLKVDLLIAAGLPDRNDKTGEVYLRTGAALSGPARFDLLTSVAVLGILLNLLRRTKGTYMNERDYLLGQLLQFADRLHIFYCKGVRGGQIPPQLLGNANVSMMMQSPKRAFDVLAERMPLYQAYATQIANQPSAAEAAQNSQRQANLPTAQSGPVEKEFTPQAEARWLLNRLGAISEALAQQAPLENTTVITRALLLLGYIGTSKKNS